MDSRPTYIMALIGCVSCTEPPPPVVFEYIDEAAPASQLRFDANKRSRWSTSRRPARSFTKAKPLGYDRFANIRGAVGLSNGVVAIADGGSRQIIFLDPSGKALRAVGGPGSAAGYFRTLTLLRRTNGDTLMAFDRRLARLTFFSPSGDFLRTVQLPWSSGRTVTDVLAASGSTVFYVVQGPAPALEGLVRPEAHIYAYDYLNSGEALLFRVPGDEFIQTRIGGETGFGLLTPLIVRRTLAAAATGGVAASDGSTFAAYVHGSDIGQGEVRMLGWEATPLTKNHADALLDGYRRSGQDVSDEIVHELGSYLPSHLPAVSDLRVDEENCIWFMVAPDEADSDQHWWIVDLDREDVGFVRIDADHELLDIGESFLLTVERRRSGDVVRMYDLQRPR